MSSLECSKCGRWVENIGDSTEKVICSLCVLMAVGLPEEKTKAYKPTGRPAGWHFMKEFVDADGNVFHKGKEMPKLKGTLPPTKITKAKVRRVKRRTKEQILIDRHNEKKQALKKAIKKQKDFLNHQVGK
jgi:hypothetical protein